LFEAHFAVDVGKDYEVLGLYLQHGLMWVYVTDELDYVRVAPSPLFSVVDGQIPSTWRTSFQEDGAVVFIAPPEVSDLYFADRVEEGDPSALDALQRIRRQKDWGR